MHCLPWPPILCMWGFKDGGVSAGSPEELAALGTDRIFTPELSAAVEAAEEETLTPSMAGFVLKTREPRTLYSGYPVECWPLKELIIDGLILSNHT